MFKHLVMLNRIAAIDPAAFLALPQDQEDAHLMGGVPQAPEPQAPAGQAPEQSAAPAPTGQAPAPVTEAQPPQGDPAQAAPPQGDGRRGDVNVPIAHLRQQNRELASRAQQAEQQAEMLASILKDPRALAAYAVQAGVPLPQQAAAQQGQQATEPDGDDGNPRLAVEDPRAVEAIVRQVVGHYEPIIQQVGGLLQQQQAQRTHQAIVENFGEDAPGILAEFDRQVPQYAQMGVDPMARLHMAYNIIRSTPEYQDAQATQAAAQGRQMAIQAVNQTLTQQTPAYPNLGDLPNAQANGQPIDVAGMQFGQFAQLPPDAEERLLRSGQL